MPRIDNKLNSVSGYNHSYTYNPLGQLKSEAITGGVTKHLGYNVTGLVAGVFSDAALNEQNKKISFQYDEGGSRLKKVNHTTNIETYYVQDASGNVMAIYEGATLKEIPLYGASRLGNYYAADESFVYELTNHLGSVQAVIARAKASDGTADVLAYNDYYAFGSTFRSGGTNYRYDYQGQFAEHDKEGSYADWHAFDLRMYDASIGRWLSTDPYGQYASPYMAMGNNPTMSVDPDGGIDAWTSAGIGALLLGGVGAAYGLKHDRDNWGWYAAGGAVLGAGLGGLVGSVTYEGTGTASRGAKYRSTLPNSYRRGVKQLLPDWKKIPFEKDGFQIDKIDLEWLRSTFTMKSVTIELWSSNFKTKEGFKYSMDVVQDKHHVKLYHEGKLRKEFFERTYDFPVSQGSGKVEITPIPDEVDYTYGSKITPQPVVKIQGKRSVKIIYDRTGFMHLKKINYREVPN